MRWLATAAAASIVATAAAGELSSDRQREILRGALNAFDDATETARDNPARAQALYRESAAALETLIDSGIRNPAMEYDLGNAYMRLGKAGLAILHYRRGLRMAPSDVKLAANLTYARNRVQPFVEETDKSRLARSLLFWHYDTSLAGRVWAVGIFSGFGWLLLLVRLNRRRLPLLVPALVSIVVSAACCGSVVWELREIEREPAAVVCVAEHILRLGSGEGSDAAMSEPLGPGVELRVIGGRGEWVEVRLVDGREGWLPAEAIEGV